MKVSREVKTALLVLAGIALFIFGYNYLKGQNILGSERVYYADYNNVEGLQPSAPITINGLMVGNVQDITFKDKTGKLRVKMIISKDFQFSKNSSAQLYEAGLIGGKAIAIIPAYDNSGNAESGTTLKGIVKLGLSELVNKRLTPLQEKIERVMIGADILLTNINDIFDERTKANLQNSIAELNTTISSFKSMSSSLNGVIKDNEEKLNSTLTNVDKASSDFSKISSGIADANLQKTIKDLQVTVTNFNNVLSKIENGEGSIGKLLNEETLYNNLEGASKELEELLRDIKLHPARYRRILSKKEIPYKSTEDNN